MTMTLVLCCMAALIGAAVSSTRNGHAVRRLDRTDGIRGKKLKVSMSCVRFPTAPSGVASSRGSST